MFFGYAVPAAFHTNVAVVVLCLLSPRQPVGVTSVIPAIFPVPEALRDLGAS